MNNNNRNIEGRIFLKKAIETDSMGAISKIGFKHKPFLKSYLASLSNHNDDTEYLTHSLFLTIINGQYKYNGNTDVQGYLCGITKRLISKDNRQEMKQGFVFTDTFSEQTIQRKLGDPVEKITTEEIEEGLFSRLESEDVNKKPPIKENLEGLQTDRNPGKTLFDK